MAKVNATLADASKEAERRARKRDNDPLSMIMSPELQEEIAEAHRKAEEYGVNLSFKRKVSRIKFAQVLQENIFFLLKTNYLTEEEYNFFNRLTLHVKYGGNYFVDDVGARNPKALNQKMLADIYDKKPSFVSRIIKQLTVKGIVGKGYSGLEQSAKNYVIFMNPTFCFSGDKTRIEPHLIEMFKEVTDSIDAFRDLPERLF